MAETRSYADELELKAYLNELTTEIDNDYTVKVQTKAQSLTDEDIASEGVCQLPCRKRRKSGDGTHQADAIHPACRDRPLHRRHGKRRSDRPRDANPHPDGGLGNGRHHRRRTESGGHRCIGRRDTDLGHGCVEIVLYPCLQTEPQHPEEAAIRAARRNNGGAMEGETWAAARASRRCRAPSN